MKCPIDNTTLQLTAREGIEIDYCPECRGVWLDRGELDKIIERSLPQPQGTREYERNMRAEGPAAHAYYRDDGDKHGSHGGHYDEHGGHYDEHGFQKKHKKESFLGDLFDF
ncbi:MAG TPA: zf-TFIIB domain-containing protein [Candidatus Saccharimonadales bacterium]